MAFIKEDICMKEMMLKLAKELQPKLQEIRRDLHRHPEVGFELTYTKEKVKNELLSMGYEPIECGKAGIVAVVGGKKQGKTILLRADMDALPIQEEANVEYISENNGRMHGCGHDMHTTMLLGAAKILKKYEDEIEGCIKLMFQPAEEIFQGSLDMINHGILENPTVDAAVMIHVLAGMPIPTGTFVIPAGGISAASCEQYHITVRGKGGHGSTPHTAIDPISAASKIQLSLQEIMSMELSKDTYGVFTTCKFEAGNASNIIPDTAQMWGTIRTADSTEQVGNYIKKRMTEIATGIGNAMRCEVTVDFYDYCPCMMIDEALSNEVTVYLNELRENSAFQQVTGSGGGSEDFAYVSHKVPTVGLFLAAGNKEEGYHYNIHNPKLVLDDSVLWMGSAAYAYIALCWLKSKS